MDDLDKTIEEAQRAVDNTRQEPTALAENLFQLALAYESRHAKRGDKDDIGYAIRNLQESIDITPAESQELAKRLNTLASLLSRQYYETGELKILQDAIENSQRSVGLTVKDDPELSVRLMNLAIQLSDRYNRTGNIDDLDKSINITQEVLVTTASDHSHLAIRLTLLARSLADRYNRSGRLEDLENAITNGRCAVHATPTGHLDLAGRLTNLASDLLSRYRQTGDLANLDEAISTAQSAVDILPDNHKDLPATLINLANCFQHRYVQKLEIDDIESAVDHANNAIQKSSPSHPIYPHILEILSNCLAHRYNRTGNIDFLEESIQNIHNAINETPLDHPSLPGRFNSLANKLSFRYTETKKLEDLEDAIKYIRQSIDQTPQGHPRFASRLGSYGNYLSNLYNETAQLPDLQQAIVNSQRAVELTSEDNPDLIGWLNNLADDLLHRYRLTHVTSDRDRALELYLRAFRCLNAIPLYRVRVARRAIQIFMEIAQYEQASSLVREAINLLPLVCNRYQNRKDQQNAVIQVSGLASEACSILLKIENNMEKALECIEHGRALIIGYLVDSRGDVSDLKKAFPEEAEEFEKLRERVAMPVHTEKSHTVQRQEREEAVTQFEQCLKDIRKRSGYERFLLPPLSSDLQSCASEGPVVVVNVTSISSDALIVLPSKLKSIHLPDLYKGQKRNFQAWGLVRSARDTAAAVVKQKDKLIHNFLKHLWFTCVRLVLEELDFFRHGPSTSELPRIWWIGTGLASSFPFHAAGMHYTLNESTIDHAISSYTPSIKMLQHAKQKRKPNLLQQAVLVVTMAKTPGERDLPGVETESAAISLNIKDPHAVQLLPQPNVKVTLKELENCNIAHFACHGSSDLADPFQSFLALQGHSHTEPERLTVQDIFDAQLGQAWLAYLSACSTAENRVAELVDESLHLASGFQIAGFSHIIASMWPSDDKICSEIASAFYNELFIEKKILEGDNGIAAALHVSVKKIRDFNLGRPQIWAQYIHLGA